MADLYTPLTWNDGADGGTPITAARGPTRWENGIEALDNALDEVADQVEALIAAGTGTIPAGPSSTRPGATLGAVYFDTGLGSAGKPIFGTGSGWVLADGTAVAGAGGSNAPQNFVGEVQSDNSIVLTWTAVGGADFYTLYETQSPNGVSGATNLTGTTTTRTPTTLRTYDYWLTATVSGVESAASNHVIVSLPFGSTPGSGGGTGGGNTPAEILNINGVDSATGGYWNLGIGFRSGDQEGAVHKDITPQTLAAGYIRANYFYPNADNSGVVFRVYMNGAKTSSNTKYPRCELREYNSNMSTKAAWSGSSGTHILQADARVMHLAPNKQEVVVGQMHDGSDDTLQIRSEGADGSAVWRASINGTEHATSLVTSYSYGTWVTYKTELINGALKIYINGTQKISTSPGYGSGQYFKAGCYAQQNVDNGNSASEYAEVELRNLIVTHSPAI